MDRKRWGLLALTLLFLVTERTEAGEGACRTGCKGAAQTFKYAQGTTYKYNYDGKIEITLSSAEGQATGTEVKATVLLTQLAECNQLLRVQNLQVLGPNGKKLGTIPDVERPIVLNVHDGVIEDSICTEPGDSQNSLNIKRAIASIFQADLRGNHETDVFGLCPTETARHSEGNNVIVLQKNRNLNKCAYREHLRQDFFTTAFDINSELKSSPILNGDYSARLKIKGGVLEQANIVEDYLYVPFSVGQNGAKAQIVSKLQLAGTSKDSPKSTCSKPRSIIFENPLVVEAPTSNVNVILNAVKEVVKTIDVVVGEQTAKEFVTLVKKVRVAKKDDLLAVYNQVKSGIGFGDKNAARRTFLDAVLWSGTGEAAEMVITLLKNNEFNEIETKALLLGLSLVKYATEPSLVTAASYLDQKNLPLEAYLGIGNLAGKFCAQHSCDNVDAVNKLTQKLISKLGDGKTTDKQIENESIYVLKALRNFGHLNDNILAKIIGIAGNKQASNRLRAVALEAYLADPCKDKLRNSALNILQDIQQDSEIRIKAYLAAAQCPNAKVGNVVKGLLEKEPSYQVGGFIVSHIRSLKASANSDKALQKQYLAFSVPKRFPIDLRKWSYNGEFSYAIDTLGLASAAETNVIYSQDSFLPRSTSLNLTAELFGHRLNLLEVQTRQENLDKLIEHYFGPKGVLRTSSIGDLLKSNEQAATKLWKHFQEKVSAAVRTRRDVSKAEVDSINKAILIKENVLNKDLDIDVSVKVFGSEVVFGNLNVYQKGLTPEAVIDKIVSSFAKGLDKLKNFKETLRTNLPLLDVEFSYPTTLGFPLRLAAEGVANVQVEAEGNIDLRALINGQDSKLRLKLIPSATVEVSGRLTLDALVAESGLKVISTLHTATGGDLTVNLFDSSRGLDVKFGLPVQEQTILSGNHEIVFHTRDQSGHEVNQPLKFAQAKDFSICVDHLSPFIGLSFCGEINGPNIAGSEVPTLPFPLAGDAKVGVTIENEDVSEYHIRRVIGDHYNSYELLVETIGKNGQPKMKFLVDVEADPEKFIKATFTSPLKTAYAEARITNNEQEKSVLAKAGFDQTEFLAKIGVAISGSANRAAYRPILDLKIPGNQQDLPVKVDGQVVAERGDTTNKYTFDNIRVALPNGKTVGLVGNIGNDRNDFYCDLSLSQDQLKANIKGRAHFEQNLLKFNGQFTNTINPQVNIDLKGEVKHKPGDYETNLQVIHGNDLSSKTNKITFTIGTVRQYNNAQDYKLAFKNKINYPLVGLDSNVEYKQTPKGLDYDVDFQYNDIKFGSELDLEINKKHQGDFEVEFEIHGLENKVEFKAERLVQGDESQISNELVVNGKKLEVKGKVKHQIKPSNVDVGATLTVTVPSHNTPFKVNSGLKYDSSGVDAHHKVTSGSTVVVDSFIKANPQGDANGKFNVNIKDMLVVNGQLKANKGSGTADLLIDAQKLKKQVKLDSTFQIQPGTTYVIDATLYPSYATDKNQKIVLSTHNKLSTTNVDSKTSLTVLGKKLEVNVGGSKTGEKDNKNIKAEVEIVLPNEQYLLGKVNLDHQVKNELLSGEGVASLEYRKNKNTSGRKVSLKEVYKNTNPDHGLLDVTYSLAADDSNGHNVNGEIALKSTRKGEERDLDVSAKVHGSIFEKPDPITANVKLNYGPTKAEGKASASAGSDRNVEVALKLSQQGEGKPCKGDLDFVLATPGKQLKTLKFGLGLSILAPEKPSDRIEVQASGHIFADDDGSQPDPIIDFKGDGSVRASDKEGEVKGNVNYGKVGPISATVGYSETEKGKEKQLKGNAAVQYGQGKHLKGEATLTKGENKYKLDAKIETPYDQYKKTSLSVETQHADEHRHIISKVKLDADGKAWTADSEWKLSEISPLVDVKVTCPDGKKTEVYWKGNRASDTEFSAEFKLLCEAKNLLIEGNIDANLNVDNLHVKSNLNSPNLNINKVYVDLQVKPAKVGRRVQITIKSANKNLVSGSTSYNAREEQGKYIVEGSGTLKVKEESKSANFKFISQRLTRARNGEQGVEISFDGGIGDEALDAELKITDKQFRILNSYCEKKKECAHIEVDSKLNANDPKTFEHITEVSVDLRKLGVSHEFGLKAVTKRQEYVFDHTVDVHFQNQGNSKYQYNLYVHPRKAGASLTTPKRVIALEAKAEVPQDIKKGGRLSGEVSFYLDKKNQPNKKASINGWLNVDGQLNNFNGEAKLVHPGLPRPLSITTRSTRTGSLTSPQVTFDLDLDVFAKPTQKLVAAYRLNYDAEGPVATIKESLNVKNSDPGLNLDWDLYRHFDRKTYSTEQTVKFKYQLRGSSYDSVASISAGKTQANLLLRVLNYDLIKATNKLNIGKEEQTVDSELSSYDDNPVVSHLEIKNWNTLSYSVGLKKTPGNKLQFNAGLIPGQIADVRADHVSGSGKVNLFHATVKLEGPNFLKPDYSVNSKEIEVVASRARDRLVAYVEGVRGVQEKWSNEIRKETELLGQVSKQNSPDLAPVKKYYETELAKIKEELLSDKGVEEAVELLGRLFGSVAQSLAGIFATFTELIESVVRSVQTAFEGVLHTIETELIPQVQRLGEKLTAIVADLSRSVVDILASYLAMISQIVERYQPEIKQFAAVFGELGQDVGRFVQKSYEQIREIVTEVFRKVYEELKALPIYEEIRAQYQHFVANVLPGREGIIAGAREIAATIKDLLPAQLVVQPEIVQLVDLTVDYIEKKLKEEPVDDFAVLDKAITIHVTIFKKLLGILAAPTRDLPSGDVSISLDFFRKLPKLVAIKFSPISYLLKEDPSEAIAVFLLSLLNNPRQWFAPFPLQTLVIQGQHIFTFDGKYLTFPANCKYLLAGDAYNNNFTLVGTFTNGQLSAITLADHRDSVTVKSNGQVLLNNAAAELPVRKQDTAAFRDYEMVHLVSTAGVTVDCTPDLQGCGVTISGFYHAQLKGLLGNGNNEPYDDFTTANGKIVTDPAEFGNSFKIGNCKPVAVPKLDHSQKNPACTKLFAWDSPLRYCFPFVRTENFEAACVHGLANGVKDTEKNIAIAYVAACRSHNIPINVPAEYVKCTNGEKPVEVGEKFSVKVPSKSADIVLVVDTAKPNEPVYKELFQPLVQELIKTLQAKGISDVQFHLIAYGGENKWPSHVTVGGKLTFKSKPPALKFAEEDKELNIPEGSVLSELRPYLEVFHLALHDLKLAFGQDLQARTFTEAFFYPFRANAAKSIVILNSRTCEVGDLFLLQKLRTLLYKNNQITLNLITPFNSFGLKESKKSKDVIGFNDEHVFTLSQAKKKPEGTAELYKDLRYEDYCVDFTVKNRGNVYVTDNFVAAKADGRKQFVHVAAHNIVEELVGVEEGLDCECRQVNPYHAYNVCKEVYAKEK